MRRIDRFQQRHLPLAFPVAVAQKFGNDQAGLRAALIAYYGLFAIFPLLLLFTTILGYVLHGDDALREQLVKSALGTFPIIGTQLRSPTQRLEGSVPAVFIGVLLLLYGAIGLGQATQAGMNAVWNVPYARRPGFVPRNLRSIAVLALIAASTIGSTVLIGFATLVPHGLVTTVILLLGSVAVNFLLILVAFQVMTALDLRWRDMALGAALAAVFWQALQSVGTWYVSRGLLHNNDVYGFFALVIVLVSWIYIGAQLFLLAAEINVVLRYRLWPRSIVQPPLTAADREVFSRLAAAAVRRPEVKVAVEFSPEAYRDPLGGPPEPPPGRPAGAPGPAGSPRPEEPARRPGGHGLRCPQPFYRPSVSPGLPPDYPSDTSPDRRPTREESVPTATPQPSAGHPYLPSETPIPTIGGSAMFVRITTVTGARNLDAGIEYLRQEVVPQLRGQNGFRGLAVSGDPVTGLAHILAQWATRSDLDASESAVDKARHEAVEVMGGQVTVERFEQLLWEGSGTLPGPGARLHIRHIRMAPELIEENFTYFKESVLPQIRSNPGFLGVRLLVDRATGDSRVGTMWADEAAMRASLADSDRRRDAAAEHGINLGAGEELSLLMMSD